MIETLELATDIRSQALEIARNYKKGDRIPPMVAQCMVNLYESSKSPDEQARIDTPGTAQKAEMIVKLLQSNPELRACAETTSVENTIRISIRGALEDARKFQQQVTRLDLLAQEIDALRAYQQETQEIIRTRLKQQQISRDYFEHLMNDLYLVEKDILVFMDEKPGDAGIKQASSITDKIRCLERELASTNIPLANRDKYQRRLAELLITKSHIDADPDLAAWAQLYYQAFYELDRVATQKEKQLTYATNRITATKVAPNPFGDFT